MGSLGDAFKKAGLISEADAKRLADEEAARARRDRREGPPPRDDRGPRGGREPGGRGRDDQRPRPERRREGGPAAGEGGRREGGRAHSEGRDHGPQGEGARRDGRSRGGQRREASPKRRAEELAHDRALGEDAYGRLRFHYEAEGGELPYLEVSEVTAAAIARGEIAIVGRRDEAWLIAREDALEVMAMDKTLIRHLVDVPAVAEAP